MSSLAGILFGLLTVIPWGIGDFCAARASRQHGAMRVLYVSQVGGLVLITIIFFAMGFVAVPLTYFFQMMLVFLFLTLGFAFFYKGLTLGYVGIISTLAASYSFVTVFLLAMMGIESIALHQWFGVIAIVIGLGLISFHGFTKRDFHLNKGILFGFGAALSWGLYYTFLPPIVHDIGWLATIFYRYLCTVLWLTIYFAIRRDLIPTFRSVGFTKDIGLIIGGELAGQFALHYGLTRSLASIIVPVSSLSPAFAMVLAYIFLKEHINITKLVGIGVILMGLVLLS